MKNSQKFQYVTFSLVDNVKLNTTKQNPVVAFQRQKNWNKYVFVKKPLQNNSSNCGISNVRPMFSEIKIKRCCIFLLPKQCNRLRGPLFGEGNQGFHLYLSDGLICYQLSYKIQKNSWIGNWYWDFLHRKHKLKLWATTPMSSNKIIHVDPQDLPHCCELYQWSLLVAGWLQRVQLHRLPHLSSECWQLGLMDCRLQCRFASDHYKRPRQNKSDPSWSNIFPNK